MPARYPTRDYRVDLANLLSYVCSMAHVTIHAAKTNLSKLIARVEAGEEIVLARGREPVAKLVPMRSKGAKRRFGVLKGQLKVGPEFFEPLPENELKSWE